MVDPALYALKDALERADGALGNADYHTSWAEQTPTVSEKAMSNVSKSIKGVRTELAEVLYLVSAWVEEAEAKDAAD
jgi:hypothetical protein